MFVIRIYASEIDTFCRRGTVTIQGGGGLMEEPQEPNEKKA